MLPLLLPVRHHSPACARMVRDTIGQLRPAAVLIEGPADFNERIDELFPGNRPPIAIYSYVAWQAAPGRVRTTRCASTRRSGRP